MWNTSMSQNPSSQPTTVEVSIGGSVTQELLETVTVQFLAAAARNRGWSKFICSKNSVEIDRPEDFSVQAGDKISIRPYDEFG